MENHCSSPCKDGIPMRRVANFKLLGIGPGNFQITRGSQIMTKQIILKSRYQGAYSTVEYVDSVHSVFIHCF